MKKHITITIPVFILAIILGMSGFLFGAKNAKVKQYSVKINTPAKTPSLPKSTNKPQVPVTTSAQAIPVKPVANPVATTPTKKTVTKPSGVNNTAITSKKPTSAPVVTPTPEVIVPVAPAVPTPTTSASPAK